MGEDRNLLAQMDIAKLISLGPKKHSLGAPGGSGNSYHWEHDSKPARRGGGANTTQIKPDRGEKRRVTSEICLVVPTSTEMGRNRADTQPHQLIARYGTGRK